ncbi:hypothetical protein TRFO_26593 [Tritrichomonas foetus]|uniref:Serine/threonine-protein phosphatase 4 regulatory subunit 3-like central domain-containing protein n=1 Tax=Tritrichomonas foetus TaxID=1144522 RepID=A0A1J4K427_9EUKA|nr:hypothetical protein TRFO_26593 [Tritrichomonas foetus]|eukprot:OHT05592.1 hypothetical protein TRFO_26593 [Tritrichomonas foetus]
MTGLHFCPLFSRYHIKKRKLKLPHKYLRTVRLISLFFSTIMSWNSSKATSSITTKLEKEECSLVDILTDDNLKIAFKKRIPKLVDFLLDNIDQIIDIALGVEVIDQDILTQNEMKSVCFSLIVNQVKSFTGLLISNDSFLSHLDSFITNDKEIDEDSVTGFARIFQFLLQQSNGNILNRWPNRDYLYEKILKHHDKIAVHVLLEDLSNDGRKPVVAFLEDNHASNVLLDFIHNNMNQGTILKNIKLFNYLANIVSGIEIDSPLLFAFESVDTMKEIYELAINTPNRQLSAQIFNFLNKVAEQCDIDDGDERNEEEEEEEDPLITSVIKYGYNNLENIIEHIQKRTPFLSDCEHATRLVNTILLRSEMIPQCVYDYTRYLFEGIFENPAHSILHQSFSMLFEIIMTEQDKCSEFVKNCNMKYRIQEVYEKRYQIIANYWGLLFNLSNKINDIISTNKDDEDWQNFKNIVLTKTQTILNVEYGGKLPSESDQSDSEEIEFPLGRSQLVNYNE